MHTRYFDLRDTKGQQKIIEDQISAAADILRQGGLVGIPTETVYGLGANALDAEAVNKIFEAKGRPQDNPLIIHIPGPQWLPRYCEDVPPLAYTLARKFWPGPLTMILKRKPIVPDATTAGLDTVGVRCPDHQVTLSIIREAGVPVAAPSANHCGRRDGGYGGQDRRRGGWRPLSGGRGVYHFGSDLHTAPSAETRRTAFGGIGRGCRPRGGG